MLSTNVTIDLRSVRAEQFYLSARDPKATMIGNCSELFNKQVRRQVLPGDNPQMIVKALGIAAALIGGLLGVGAAVGLFTAKDNVQMVAALLAASFGAVFLVTAYRLIVPRRPK